jgi:hypothetical protein
MSIDGFVFLWTNSGSCNNGDVVYGEELVSKDGNGYVPDRYCKNVLISMI